MTDDPDEQVLILRAQANAATHKVRAAQKQAESFMDEVWQHEKMRILGSVPCDPIAQIAITTRAALIEELLEQSIDAACPVLVSHQQSSPSLSVRCGACNSGRVRKRRADPAAECSDIPPFWPGINQLQSNRSRRARQAPRLSS